MIFHDLVQQLLDVLGLDADAEGSSSEPAADENVLSALLVVEGELSRIDKVLDLDLPYARFRGAGGLSEALRPGSRLQVPNGLNLPALDHQHDLLVLHALLQGVRLRSVEHWGKLQIELRRMFARAPWPGRDVQDYRFAARRAPNPFRLR